jgi:hypothetical protein
VGGLFGRYEIGVFEDGALAEVFRTDSRYAVKAVRAEAERYLRRLVEENPDKDYKIVEVNSNGITGIGWWACGN